MIAPDGFRKNGRYAERSACPRCGSMLVRLDAPARVVVRGRPIAEDDREVAAKEGDGFKSVTVRRGWLHEATLRCPGCGALLSPAQAVRRDFAPSELPGDFWVPDVPDSPERRALMFARVSDALSRAAASRRRAAAPPAPAPVQQTLWDASGGGAVSGGEGSE